jgi:hypothetical protein
MRQSRFFMTVAGLIAFSVVSATAQPNSSSTDRNAMMRSGKTSEQNNGDSMKSTNNGYEQKQDVSGSGQGAVSNQAATGSAGKSPGK